MRVAILGASGQLGSALRACAPPKVELISLTRATLDITDERSVAATFRNVRPAVIINAAAYTAVDAAEGDPEAAYKVNAHGAGVLARTAQAVDAAMVHVSTDFVFDGSSSSPYAVDAIACPLSIYGRSKALGETSVLHECKRALVVRTAWVYEPGHRNFVETMLRRMRADQTVSVVADQIGTPTSATTLASVIWRLVDLEANGVLHVTDAGVASWYDFAVAIADLAMAHGMLGTYPYIRPIATSEFPTAAVRPMYSVLDKRATTALLDEPLPHWRRALETALMKRKDLDID